MGESSDDEDSGGGSQSGASIKPGIDLDIGNTLKRILEQDHDLIINKNKVFLNKNSLTSFDFKIEILYVNTLQDTNITVIYNQLVVLPAQPTVINILESWVHHFTTTQLTNIPEKPQRNKANNTLEKTVNDVNLCREVADGLRIYFNFTLPHLLLYRQEREQYSSPKSFASINERSGVAKEDLIE